MNRSLIIVLVVMVVLGVGGLAWIMLNDPGNTPPADRGQVREIAPGTYSTKPAPWADRSMTFTEKVRTGLFVFLAWGVWAPLAAYAQHQRAGSIRMGLVAGLLFGPLGLLVANYSGGRRCPSCQGYVGRATRCRSCGADVGTV